MPLRLPSKPNPALSVTEASTRSASPLRTSDTGHEAAKADYEEKLEKFAKALQKFNPAILRRFEIISAGQPPDADSVISAVTDIIQIASRKRPTSLSSSATTGRKVLEQINRFAPLGDVVVGGAQNLAASGAWGAIRLAIEVCTE